MEDGLRMHPIFSEGVHCGQQDKREQHGSFRQGNRHGERQASQQDREGGLMVQLQRADPGSGTAGLEGEVLSPHRRLDRQERGREGVVHLPQEPEVLRDRLLPQKRAGQGCPRTSHRHRCHVPRLRRRGQRRCGRQV
ncbi:MAG: hypothetical protein US74_C0006G0050 [Parcubacteria group bacterium GW2011_GWA2_38_13]|nr:MAG: hypothetical protein US74_C0006G0050 [Parcubacteria group bacterium GW2011_GWA2_38_13]